LGEDVLVEAVLGVEPRDGEEERVVLVRGDAAEEGGEELQCLLGAVHLD
jgi:hypothetical protein